MKANAGVAVLNPPGISFDHKRDAYGFAVRPQHLQRYREYANIYKEEEEERSERWKDFLQRQAESAQIPVDVLSTDGHGDKLLSGSTGLGKDDEPSRMLNEWLMVQSGLEFVIFNVM